MSQYIRKDYEKEPVKRDENNSPWSSMMSYMIGIKNTFFGSKSQRVDRTKAIQIVNRIFNFPSRERNSDNYDFSGKQKFVVIEMQPMKRHTEVTKLLQRDDVTDKQTQATAKEAIKQNNVNEVDLSNKDEAVHKQIIIDEAKSEEKQTQLKANPNQKTNTNVDRAPPQIASKLDDASTSMEKRSSPTHRYESKPRVKMKQIDSVESIILNIIKWMKMVFPSHSFGTLHGPMIFEAIIWIDILQVRNKIMKSRSNDKWKLSIGTMLI